MGLKHDILIGLAVVGVLVLIVGVFVGILMLLTKAIGLLLVLGGIFMMFFFPDIAEFQAHEMSKTGIVIGIIFIVLGVWLILT